MGHCYEAMSCLVKTTPNLNLNEEFSGHTTPMFYRVLLSAECAYIVLNEP